MFSLVEGSMKLESEEFSKKYEEKRRIMKKKEEIIQKKLKKRIKLEIQQMGLLSIISKKPKANNSCQHLGSIMILSKENSRGICQKIFIKYKFEFYNKMPFDI